MTSDAPSPSAVSPVRLALKTAFLFVLANLTFALLDPMPLLGRISIYNSLVPGRTRLPYGDAPAADYNVSPFSLEAMFASHEIAAAQPRADEFRVLLIGDSATWGFLLPPDATLASALNDAGYLAPDGRRVRAFNLGYPIMSLTKDLLLMDLGLESRPDLIVWLVTLESFPLQKQLYPPLLQHNPERVRSLIARYHLRLSPDDPRFVADNFWSRTFIGRRRDLADLWRLQLDGVLWAATRIDQDIPESYTPRMEDLPADLTFQDFGPNELAPEDLAFDVLAAGAERAGAIPLLIVNEPMFLSRGENSDLRYNFYYPRWAYDEYRDWLRQTASAEGWPYLDLWDLLPGSEFTDSAIHYDPTGARGLAGRIAAWIASGE
jgi:hypothetical protein